MEEISVKGEVYIKASMIAEKFGYTADYVGQLCRSGQVDATLVGRSWYVSEKSLQGHKKTRYRSNLTKTKEAVRKLAENRPSIGGPRFMQRISKYENDDSALIPVTSKEKESEEISDVIISDSKNTYNKPQINQVSSLSENLSHTQFQEKELAKPSIRIISAQSNITTRGGKLTLDSKQRLGRGSESKNAPKRGFLVVFSVLLCMIVLSVGLAIGVNGLEKHLVTLDSGAYVTLYNFDLSKAKDFLLSYF